jgi:hypothetical protein
MLSIAPHDTTNALYVSGVFMFTVGKHRGLRLALD